MYLPANTWNLVLLVLSLLSGINGNLKSEEYYEEYEDEIPLNTTYKLNVPDSFKSYLEHLLTKGNITDEIEENDKEDSSRDVEETVEEFDGSTNYQNTNRTNASEIKNPVDFDNTLQSLSNTLEASQSIGGSRPKIYHPYRTTNISQLLSGLGKGSSVYNLKSNNHNHSIFHKNNDKPSRTPTTSNDILNTGLSKQLNSKPSTEITQTVNQSQFSNNQSDIQQIKYTKKPKPTNKVNSKTNLTEMNPNINGILNKTVTKSFDKSNVHPVLFDAPVSNYNLNNKVGTKHSTDLGSSGFPIPQDQSIINLNQYNQTEVKHTDIENKAIMDKSVVNAQIANSDSKIIQSAVDEQKNLEGFAISKSHKNDTNTTNVHNQIDSKLIPNKQNGSLTEDTQLLKIGSAVSGKHTLENIDQPKNNVSIENERIGRNVVLKRENISQINAQLKSSEMKQTTDQSNSNKNTSTDNNYVMDKTIEKRKNYEINDTMKNRYDIYSIPLRETTVTPLLKALPTTETIYAITNKLKTHKKNTKSLNSPSSSNKHTPNVMITSSPLHSGLDQSFKNVNSKNYNNDTLVVKQLNERNKANSSSIKFTDKIKSRSSVIIQPVNASKIQNNKTYQSYNESNEKLTLRLPTTNKNVNSSKKTNQSKKPVSITNETMVGPDLYNNSASGDLTQKKITKKNSIPKHSDYKVQVPSDKRSPSKRKITLEKSKPSTNTNNNEFHNLKKQRDIGQKQETPTNASNILLNNKKEILNNFGNSSGSNNIPKLDHINIFENKNGSAKQPLNSSTNKRESINKNGNLVHNTSTQNEEKNINKLDTNGEINGVMGEKHGSQPLNSPEPKHALKKGEVNLSYSTEPFKNISHSNNFKFVNTTTLKPHLNLHTPFTKVQPAVVANKNIVPDVSKSKESGKHSVINTSYVGEVNTLPNRIRNQTNIGQTHDKIGFQQPGNKNDDVKLNNDSSSFKETNRATVKHLNSQVRNIKNITHTHIHDNNVQDSGLISKSGTAQDHRVISNLNNNNSILFDDHKTTDNSRVVKYLDDGRYNLSTSGKANGFNTTSLYTYVASKNETEKHPIEELLNSLIKLNNSKKIIRRRKKKRKGKKNLLKKEQLNNIQIQPKTEIYKSNVTDTTVLPKTIFRTINKTQNDNVLLKPPGVDNSFIDEILNHLVSYSELNNELHKDTTTLPRKSLVPPNIKKHISPSISNTKVGLTPEVSDSKLRVPISQHNNTLKVVKTPISQLKKTVVIKVKHVNNSSPFQHSSQNRKQVISYSPSSKSRRLDVSKISPEKHKIAEINTSSKLREIPDSEIHSHLRNLTKPKSLPKENYINNTHILPKTNILSTLNRTKDASLVSSDKKVNLDEHKPATNSTITINKNHEQSDGSNETTTIKNRLVKEPTNVRMPKENLKTNLAVAGTKKIPRPSFNYNITLSTGVTKEVQKLPSKSISKPLENNRFENLNSNQIEHKNISLTHLLPKENIKIPFPRHHVLNTEKEAFSPSNTNKTIPLGFEKTVLQLQPKNISNSNVENMSKKNTQFYMHKQTDALKENLPSLGSITTFAPGYRKEFLRNNSTNFSEALEYDALKSPIANQLVNKNENLEPFKPQTNTTPVIFQPKKRNQLIKSAKAYETFQNRISNNKTDAQHQLSDTKGKSAEGIVYEIYSMLKQFLGQATTNNTYTSKTSIPKKFNTSTTSKDKLTREDNLKHTTEHNSLSQREVGQTKHSVGTSVTKLADGKSAITGPSKIIQKLGEETLLNTRPEKIKNFITKKNQFENKTKMLNISKPHPNANQTYNYKNNTLGSKDKIINNTIDNKISNLETESSPIKITKHQSNISNKGVFSVQAKPTLNGTVVDLKSDNKSSILKDSFRSITPHFENPIKSNITNNVIKAKHVMDVKEIDGKQFDYLLNSSGSTHNLTNISTEPSNNNNQVHENTSSKHVLNITNQTGSVKNKASRENINNENSTKSKLSKPDIEHQNESFGKIVTKHSPSLENGTSSKHNTSELSSKQQLQKINLDHTNRTIRITKNSQPERSYSNNTYIKGPALIKVSKHNESVQSPDKHTRKKLQPELNRTIENPTQNITVKINKQKLEADRDKHYEPTNNSTTKSNNNGGPKLQLNNDTLDRLDVKQPYNIHPVLISKQMKKESPQSTSPKARHRNDSLVGKQFAQNLDKHSRLHIIITPLDTKPNISVEISVENQNVSAKLNPFILQNKTFVNLGRSEFVGLNKNESKNANDSDDLLKSHDKITLRSFPKFNLTRNITNANHTNNHYFTMKPKLPNKEVNNNNGSQEIEIKRLINAESKGKSKPNISKEKSSDGYTTKGITLITIKPQLTKKEVNTNSSSQERESKSLINTESTVTSKPNISKEKSSDGYTSKGITLITIKPQLTKNEVNTNSSSQERESKSLINTESTVTSKPNISKEKSNSDGFPTKGISLDVRNSNKIINRKRISKKEEVVEINEKMKENKILGKSKTVQTIKTEVSSVDYE